MKIDCTVVSEKTITLKLSEFEASIICESLKCLINDYVYKPEVNQISKEMHETLLYVLEGK